MDHGQLGGKGLLGGPGVRLPLADDALVVVGQDGHILRGGKGVLVGAGAALATEPIACLVLLVIFLVEVAITHIVSLGSIIIAALYPVLTLCYWLWKGTDAASLVFITVCCVLMGAYVIWLHRSNIQRLKNGTEYRFGEKKKENQ
jgi:glycerol-3-phosphate acyltransferase PlsY